jgi:hypothetical protein
MRLVIECGKDIQPQVFESDTTAGLIAKLMVAQKHATIKIREQQQKIKLLCRIGSSKENKK